MARFNLPTMARRQRNIRRKRIVLREIAAPATMATDLFRSAYLPVVKAWEEGLPRILATYERTLAEMTTDAPADVAADIDGIGEQVRRLLLTLTPRMQDWALRVESFVRRRWRGAVLSASGVDLSTMIGPEDMRETIETVIARNVALVKDVSAQAQARISDAVFRGLNQRRPARDVAKDIREAVAMARRRSIGIASHQLSDISNRLADERRREAGLDEWIWRHSRKKNFRPDHKARDGKVYSDANPPPERPGQLPYCGCRSQAVLRFD